MCVGQLPTEHCSFEENHMQKWMAPYIYIDAMPGSHKIQLEEHYCINTRYLIGIWPEVSGQIWIIC